MRIETRHSLVLVIGTGITTVLSLAYIIYAQNTLGTALASEFTTALSLVAFCQIAFGPINGIVARFTAQYAGRGKLGQVRALYAAVLRRVALYVLVGLIIAMVAVKPLASFWRFNGITPLLTAYGIIYAILLLSVGRGVLRGLQAFGRLNANTISESAIRLGGGVAILTLVVSPTAALLPYVAALLVTLGLTHVQLARSWRNRPAEAVDGREIKRFTGPMFIMMMTSAGFQNIDMLMVKHLFAESEAGVYAAAFMLARCMSALVTPFNTLLLPLLASMHEQGMAVASTFLRVGGYFLLLALVPILAFTLWPEEIVGLLYKPGFAGAASIVLVVTLARLLGYLSHMIALAWASDGRFRFLLGYVPALVAQAAALAVWHASLRQVATVLLVGHGVVLIMLVGHVLFYRATRRQNAKRQTPEP